MQMDYTDSWNGVVYDFVMYSDYGLI
jgi:hypothetical protein